MNCAQSEELLSPHLDNELPAAQAAEVARHLLSCPSCGGRFDELKRASRAVRGLTLAPLPPGFLSRLEARRRAAPAAAAPASSWWSPQAFAWATAAAVVAIVVVGPWRQSRLAHAPGYALPEASDAAPPSLKLAAEPPPPAAAGGAEVRAAFAQTAQSPMPLPPSENAAPEDHLVRETADLLVATARANAREADAARKTDGGAPYGSAPTYTNEDLHKMMQEESSREGIEVAGEDDAPKHEPFMGERLGQADTHEKAERSIRQLAAMRQAVEASSGKASIVPIEGSVAPILGASAERGGAAVAEGAFADGFWSGDFAAGNEGTRTIEDARSWAALWRTLSASAAPAVDFKRSRVVAVFLGPRPTGGYSIEFTDIARTARRIVVRWREGVPEPGQSPPDGATSPYALKVIPRNDLPVRFEKVR